VRLFHRTTRRLSLTEEGRHYLPSARDVLLAADAADLALKAEAREPAGQLTIAAPVLFGHMYVAPAIVRFMQRHQKVRCSVRLHDRAVNLLEEGIDVGHPHQPAGRFVAGGASAGHHPPRGGGKPRLSRAARHAAHPRELDGAPCVRGRVDAPSQWLFHEGGKSIGVTPDARLEFNHIAPAIEACAAGMGFGTFFSYQVLPHVAQGRLALVLEDFEPPPRPVSVIYPNARLLPARTRAFIEWMKTEFSGLRL
jgi:DNA-binding transcriptional LysR family regulator